MMDEQVRKPAGGAPTISVASSPHLHDPTSTTRRMMLEVLIALVPTVMAAVFFYGHWAVWQLLLCVGGCVATEYVFTTGRGRRHTLDDFSAVVTGVILALSLPWNAPWFVSLIGAAVAIAIGKMVFGGLGMNLFNPAMVGRAFVMLAFTTAVGASAYLHDVDRNSRHDTIVSINQTIGGQAAVDALSGATPLTAAKESGTAAPTSSLLVSSTYASLGERGMFVLLGAIVLLLRRTILWQIPIAALLTAALLAGLAQLTASAETLSVADHLFGGAFLLGAFFIITDPVTSPITPVGRWVFGAMFGVLVMLFRLWSNYPEGVMFSVLLVNAVVPLINRWTVPRPFGGFMPAKT